MDADGRRRFIAEEIIGWSISSHCLEKMADKLKEKDQWLISKPELLSQHIRKVNTSGSFLENILLRVEEAKNNAEFFTPALKHQMTIAHMKLLSFSGQFQSILNEVSDEYTLLDKFRGLIRSICDIENISINELSNHLESPIKELGSIQQPIKLISNISNGDRSA